MSLPQSHLVKYLCQAAFCTIVKPLNGTLVCNYMTIYGQNVAFSPKYALNLLAGTNKDFYKQNIIFMLYLMNWFVITFQWPIHLEVVVIQQYPHRVVALKMHKIPLEVSLGALVRLGPRHQPLLCLALLLVQPRQVLDSLEPLVPQGLGLDNLVCRMVDLVLTHQQDLEEEYRQAHRDLGANRGSQQGNKGLDSLRQDLEEHRGQVLVPRALDSQDRCRDLVVHLRQLAGVRYLELLETQQ